MSDLIVRCSSIGKLMAKPENGDLDPQHMTAELQAIISKTKRTDAEKALLEHARMHSLSAGGKTHVRDLVREAVYGFEPAEVNTYPIRKGREVEAECIAMLARLTGRPLVKNTERRTNGVISGECDVWDAPIRCGRDVKAPYSMASMPIALADAYDSGYEWQMQGYMILWDADLWSVDYVLVNTPDELIGYEPPALHCVDHIPENLRWTAWAVERDRSLEPLILAKVSAARRYFREVLNEFDRTHCLPGEPAQQPAVAAAPGAAKPKAQAELATPDF